MRGTSVPQTGFYRTFRIEPPLFRVPFLKFSQKWFHTTLKQQGTGIPRPAKRDLSTWSGKKKAQRLTFWVRRPPAGGAGVFHAKGCWPKSSCSPSKVCLPWVSKRGIWDVPGILRDVPDPCLHRGVPKVCAKKRFVRIFRAWY